MKRLALGALLLLLAGCSAEIRRVTTIESDAAAQVAASQGLTLIITAFLIVAGVVIVALISLEMVSQWLRERRHQ